MEDGNATARRIERGVPCGGEDRMAHVVHWYEIGDEMAIASHHVKHAHAARQAYPGGTDQGVNPTRERITHGRADDGRTHDA